MKRILEDSPCRNCGKFFTPTHASIKTCNFSCKRVVHFAGNPTSPLSLENRNRLVMQWAGLARKYAVQFHARWYLAQKWLTVNDLYQEGILGLFVAAERYDPNNAGNAQFQTYAFWWVNQHIRRAIANCSLVRLPEHKIMGESPEIQAVYGTCGLPDDFDVIEANDPPKDSEREVLERVLNVLTGRQKQVVVDRFGLGADGVELGLRELGCKFGISKERIRQEESAALQTIRDYLYEGTDDVCVNHPRDAARLANQRRLDVLQRKMERLWDEHEVSGDPAIWKKFLRMERAEDDLRCKLGHKPKSLRRKTA